MVNFAELQNPLSNIIDQEKGIWLGAIHETRGQNRELIANFNCIFTTKYLLFEQKNLKLLNSS